MKGGSLHEKIIASVFSLLHPLGLIWPARQVQKLCSLPEAPDLKEQNGMKKGGNIVAFFVCISSFNL
ncbi:hypothetical protein QKW52_02715 [Bacillus sonorensis]|nr:hypothetical protein [Bacillus sonorensis]